MFLTRRFYILITLCAVIMAAGMLAPFLLLMGQVLLVLLAIAVAAETLLLYTVVRVGCTRVCAARFSNGDDNTVSLRMANLSSFWLSALLVWANLESLPPSPGFSESSLPPVQAVRIIAIANINTRKIFFIIY